MIKHCLAVFALLTVSVTQAQDFHGTATYQTASTIDFNMDSSKVPVERQKFIKEMMAKAMRGEYMLAFDRTSSLYKEVETLEESGPGGRGGRGGFKVMLGSVTGGNSIFYKNTKQKQLIEQTEFFGKQFLIKDSLENFEWKLENESKQVGSYTCYKATTIREVKELTFSASSSGDKEENSVVTKTVTAWYTPQIPLNHGPRGYWGLPGLILELNDGTTTILCSKVVLNSKDKEEITEPDDGKLVTNNEYKEIITKKIEEMREMNGGGGRGRGGRGHGGRGSFTIEMRN